MNDNESIKSLLISLILILLRSNTSSSSEDSIDHEHELFDSCDRDDLLKLLEQLKA